jgi:hypothetical protein
MAINISGAGAAGAHSFTRVNVNSDDNYIYFRDSNIPASFVDGTTFIYKDGVGSIDGITDGDLVYIDIINSSILKLNDSSNSAEINLTGSAAGGVTFNTPIVYNNTLQIGASTPTNQAVKYYTDGTPLTGLTSGNTYFLKNVTAAFTGTQSLYTISGNTHTFTTCGQTGRVGPTIAQMRSAYTGATTWSGTYLQQGIYQGYQDWTVPISGIYEFTVNGASGFNGAGAGGVGLGAIVKGRVTLTKGEIITIAVGQVGAAPAAGGLYGGSGGGTFVVRKAGDEPLFVAGGGTAESNSGAGRNGVLTNLAGTSTNNRVAGGISGNGGVSTGGFSAAGGGFNSRGQAGPNGELGGGSWFEGLSMLTNSRNGGYGGFGGGGQSEGNTTPQAAGAGGYSGGGGARSGTSTHSGGGGGSFIATTATNVATSTGSYNGSALFNSNAITNLAAYNTGEGSVVMSIISTFTTGNEVYPTAADSEAGTNRISIAPAGSSYHAFVPINYDAQNDLIHSATAHTLSNGEAVVLNFTTPPTGLTNATTYYVDKVNNFTYRLSTTPSPTFTTINLTIPSGRETSTSSTISRVVVNTAEDTLTISSHGFLVNQPLIYSAGGGTRIAPLVDGSTYYVQEVLDANRIRLKLNLNSVSYINLTAAGTGTSHSFIFSTINADRDEIYIANHGLVDGQAVRYSNNGGTTIPGLTNNATYYIKTTDPSLITLATTSALTTIANITGAGTGTQQLLITALDYANDKITLPSHGFLAGELVLYDAKGQTVVNGLTTATPYYVIFIDQDNIKLATTPENAIAGTAVNLTDTPAGVGRHTLQSLSKTPDGIYTITSLDQNDPTTFTVAAQGSVPEITKTFNPRSTIDIPQNAFIIPSHGFLTGTKVNYSKGAAATAISGLVDLTDYYVVAINKDYLRLASSAENAAAGTVVTVADFGTGVAHSLTTNQINGNVTGAGSVTITSGSVLVSGTGTQFTKILKVGDNFRLFPPNTTKTHGTVQFAAADINTSTDQIAKSHTMPTGQAVVFSAGGGTAPTGLVEGTTYFVRAVSTTAITLHTSLAGAQANTGLVDITAAGTGTAFTLSASTVNLDLTFAAANINTSTDVITIAHPFTTGTQVIFDARGGTAPSGLVTNDSYFVRNTSFTSLTLHPTAADAAAGTATIDITAAGTGLAFRLFADQTDFSAVNVDTTTNRITRSHNFVTGDTVKFSAGGGVAPSPLVDGYYYFVRAISATEISLHGSAADATSNTSPADFSTTGTGSLFALTKTTAVGPIIRRIAAIGSDTQISVDRPYSGAFTAASYSYPTFIYVRPEGYSLHRPFDGGVEMSVGTGTSWGQIVRQTRKYFRYQSGKGLQTSCGINFKPSIDIESMIRINSNTIECTTRRPHGLINDLFVVISEAKDSNGVTSTVYNGNFQVSIPTGITALTRFRITKSGGIPEARAYGFPQFYVREWSGGAVRTGMFDFQNGMFFEFDGQKIYAVRRSSTQQMAGTVSALQGNEVIFGTGTSFQAQLVVGDYVVMRGQSYRVTQIDSQTRMSVRPEYKGSSGTEKEFNPSTVVDTSTDLFTIVGHGFTDLLPVVYNSIDGESIGGLVNGRTYYISVISGNTFKLKASPDAVGFVNLSSVGTTTVHSLTPAKSGIIVTKTVDTKIPQEDWSIDPCDGTGVTGYNLDLSKIQMAYCDYSWYGAGKIRFGFKTTDGQVQYVHEFVHNNNLFESYFRSGNLPARYEVVTYDNPTYIPFLFHWGTSVMMDGRFDDDNAYLFTQNSQTLNIAGTTAKSFASTGINLTTDLMTVQTHGFRSGDLLQFESIGSNGLRGSNALHPATQVIGSNTSTTLTNGARYKAFVNSANLIHLTPENATITVGATVSRSTNVVTFTTATPHGIPSSSNNVGVYFVQDANGAAITNIPTSYVGPVTVTSTTSFTLPTSAVTGSFTVASTPVPNAAIGEVLNFTSQGNTQYTYFLYPNGSLNNTSGPNYQPLISLRLSPSVSSGLTGKLGDRDVINRMQLRLKEIGISSTNLVDVKILLNPRLNNLNFTGVDAPSLTQVVEHTAADTVSGGVQVYNFRGAGGGSVGLEGTTTVDVSSLFELSNSILGGDSIFPDGPDIITIAVARLTGNATLASAKLSWSEAQA